MDAHERTARYAEAQAMTEEMVKRGWVCEDIQTSHEYGEPFKVVICLSVSGEDPKDGVL